MNKQHAKETPYDPTASGITARDAQDALDEIAGGTVIDHGTLAGLADDDHAQYIRVDGTRAFAGNIDAGGNSVVNAAISANLLTSGTLPDARIASTGVTQHEASIDHDALANFSAGEHRIINDAGTSATELWSASKISSELADKKGVLRSVTTETASTTLDSTDDVVLVDASGGAITITLPAAATDTGREYTIKKIDTSANAVTVDGNGSETIDNATTAVLGRPYDAIQIVSDGTEWWIL